ncbi:MAG TPA: protein kinase [Gemmatimonadaceae bacterium]|nr:protein kinase [Gemmatimonadaceae bacterium]
MQEGHGDPLAALKAALADRYRFDHELGRGGMATVFLAEDLKHRRRVAIKILKPEIALAVGAARFLREIEISAQLTHPNLLPLHDSGEAAGFLYYVMPFIEGETLRDRLQRERQLPLEEAINIACDVADGLHYAHEHNIVHRDVKPENILLQGGHAIVADFGIARAVTASARESLTSSGVVIGTAQYMSPEQGLGESEIGLRSDIYSVGCVLYEMLVGEPPYTGRTVQAIVARHAAAEIPSLRLVRPDVPEEIENIVRKALGKVPAARFASAAALSQALRSYGKKKPRFRLRGKRKLAAIAAVLVIGTLGVLVLAKKIFAGPLEQNDWILVADFDGPANDPGIASAYRDLVTAALGQSQFVRLMDRRQLNEVMRLAGIPETTFVDVDLARQLAQRSSVRAVLVGGIQPLGSGYSLVAHVVSAEKGNALASAAATASGPHPQDGLVSAADDEVRQLRAQLGERHSEIAEVRPLRDVATPSFDAYRYYSEALDRMLMRGDYSGSTHLLQRALALDSGFVPAWVALGANYLTVRQIDSARLAYSRALSLPQRLSPAEQYRLKGDVAYALDHNVAAAVKWYDLYLAETPYSRVGLSNRGLYRSALGDYEGAATDFQNAADANPFGRGIIQPILLNLAAIQVVLGRRSEAEQTLKDLSGPFAQYVRIMLAMADARWASADSVASTVLATPATPAVFRLNAITAHASALAARGEVGAADSVLRMEANASTGAIARWYERARLLLAIAGDTPISRPPNLVPSDTTMPADMLRALWAAAAGDTASARKMLGRVNGLSRSSLAVVGNGPTLIEAMLAADAGQWRAVAERIGPVALSGEFDPTMLDRPDNYLLRWVAAKAYANLGKPDSSAILLKLMLSPTRMPPGHLALRGLAYAPAMRKLGLLRPTGLGRPFQQPTDGTHRSR